jgi:protein-L-isoaspartate O-methyltransferase
MNRDEPSLASLERLATSAELRDRAFASSVLRLWADEGDAGEVARLYERVRETARTHHEAVRAHIRNGTLDKQAFVATLREAPIEVRDHLVEEILDIAYPPLEEISLPSEAFRYTPSGLSEILFVLEKAGLGPGKTFVDLGSGLGKAVLLVALLTGARVHGIEIDPHLVDQARSAARSLRLDEAYFTEGDIRDAPLPPGDVYYMFIPLVRSADVVDRLAPLAAQSKILVFSQTLDPRRFPWLKATGRTCYWLEMYEAIRDTAT